MSLRNCENGMTSEKMLMATAFDSAAIHIILFSSCTLLPILVSNGTVKWLQCVPELTKWSFLSCHPCFGRLQVNCLIQTSKHILVWWSTSFKIIPVMWNLDFTFLESTLFLILCMFLPVPPKLYKQSYILLEYTFVCHTKFLGYMFELKINCPTAFIVKYFQLEIFGKGGLFSVIFSPFFYCLHEHFLSYGFKVASAEQSCVAYWRHVCVVTTDFWGKLWMKVPHAKLIPVSVFLLPIRLAKVLTVWLQFIIGDCKVQDFFRSMCK